MKRYAVRHETRYTYQFSVDIGMHVARLSPVNTSLQRRLEHTIDVTPTPVWAVAQALWQQAQGSAAPQASVSEVVRWMEQQTGTDLSAGAKPPSGD